MHLGDALVPLVRRKLRSASPDRQLQATFAVVERVNDATIAALGDRSADPSHDDMIDAMHDFPEFGVALVQSFARRIDELNARTLELEALVARLHAALREAGLEPPDPPAGDS